ncbi:hypothetical protein OAS91_02160 [Gammaproteobacteria bacterium]|nr:hypothetical protein [Gammaproteobacteria bacterium]
MIVLIYKQYKKNNTVSFTSSTLIAIFAYFISRLVLGSSKQVFAGLLISLLIIAGSMVFSYGLTILAAHLFITGFSVAVLVITFFETTLLERHITKIKKGEIGSNAKSVEQEYSEIFELIGIGLLCISLSLLSGIIISSAFSLELIFKGIFTVFALIIYLLTFLGVKFASLKVKYAVRGIMLSFAMVILAYSVNSIFVTNYL